KRLIDIGSRITLKAKGSETLQVPRDPEHIDGNSNTLVQVVPERSPGIGGDEPLMDANECDSVSQRIVNGKEVVIGNAQEGPVLAGSVSAQWGEINHIATAIRGTGATQQVTDFPQKMQQAEQSFPNVYSPNLPISQDVESYLAAGLFRRKHLVPRDQILRALSLPGIPREVWKQVYELHVGKTERQRPETIVVLNYVNKFLQLQRVRAYQTVRNDNQRNARLGVNEHAAPEVGESFSSLSQASPQAVGEDGVLSHDLDISTLSNGEIDAVYRGLLGVQANALRLGSLVGDQYARVRGVVPYREHHAAVVAKDGGDTITFENYNRSGEEDSLKMDLWDDLMEEFTGFDRNIKKELKDIRGETLRVKANPEYDPVEKLRRITQLRKQHLEMMREKFLVVQEYTGLKVESNLGENNNELWHFNMYGPAHRTYLDPEGTQKPQSFHETWSPSVANAITVRTTAKNDEFFTRSMIEKVKERVGAIAFRAVQESGFTESRLAYEALLKSLLDPIVEAK